MKEFIISEKECGQRFDKYLFKVLDRAPAGFIYKMLRKKNIVLNEKKSSGKEILRERDQVKIYLSDDTFSKFASAVQPCERARPEEGRNQSAGKNANTAEQKSGKAEVRDLDIVYEDRDILVISKPAGLLSQKASANDDSANDRIIAYLLESGQITPEELRTFHPSICNRLDRNTSGLLIAGKTMHGLQQTAEDLRNRSVKKYYRTLVRDRVTEPQRLNGYLAKDPRTNQVRVISADSKRERTEKSICGREPENSPNFNKNQSLKSAGLPIETAYRPIGYFGNATLLEVHLITGRSHQIRAHLASVGHPVLGDPKYGDPELNRALFQATGIRGQLLHACRMEFPDGRVINAAEPDTFRMAEEWLAASR